MRKNKKKSRYEKNVNFWTNHKNVAMDIRGIKPKKIEVYSYIFSRYLPIII